MLYNNLFSLKSIILLLHLFIYTALSAQSIAVVDLSNDGYAKVFDEKNNKIASGYIGSSSDHFDYSNCIIVSRSTDGYVKVFDPKLNKIASGYAGNKQDILKVTSCNIIFKSADGYKTVYDKNLNKISSGY